MSSILPGNLSDLERDLDAALARIAEIDIPIAELWNPFTCPADVLPYLAWAMSVDIWRTNWPQRVKRQVIAGSVDVHKQKGTRPAVEKALADIGIHCDIIEWFEASPQAERGTFELIAWANTNLTPDEVGYLNEALYQQVFAAVNNAKNARSHYTLKVGAQFGPNTISTGAVFGSAALLRRDATVVQPPLASEIGISAAVTGWCAGFVRRSSTLKMEAQPTPVTVSIAAAANAYAFIYQKMEATT